MKLKIKNKIFKKIKKVVKRNPLTSDDLLQ